MKLFLYTFDNFCWFVGSLDIENVEKLLEEIESIKENEATKQTDKNVPDANNYVSSNTCNTKDDVVFDKLQTLEPKKKIEASLEVSYERLL